MSNIAHGEICQHCFKRDVSRQWRLCRTCYNTPEIRVRYRPRTLFVGDFRGYGKPTTPTKYAPGTEGKIQELARRAEAGERMWHPQDAKNTAWRVV